MMGKISNAILEKIKIMKGDVREHIWVDDLYLLELKKEMCKENPYLDISNINEIHGLRIIPTHNLDAPCGKVNFIIGGTTWR